MKRLIVVEALAPVIDWHRQGLVPNGSFLTTDPRCVYRHADFFALAVVTDSTRMPEKPGLTPILLDIDHTPESWLHSSHKDFYSADGMDRLKSFLKPHGIFALWSNDPPEDNFLKLMSTVFASAEGHRVDFDNPLQETVSTNGVYVARLQLSTPYS